MSAKRTVAYKSGRLLTFFIFCIPTLALKKLSDSLEVSTKQD